MIWYKEDVKMKDDEVLLTKEEKITLISLVCREQDINAKEGDKYYDLAIEKGHTLGGAITFIDAYTRDCNFLKALKIKLLILPTSD